MTPGQKPPRERSKRRHSAVIRCLQVLGIGVAVIGVVLARPARPVQAHSADATFAEDVAPILYKNCTMCHRPDGAGPFPLFEFDSAKAYTHEMRERVSAGEMPPWHAVGPRGVFRNDRRLSDSDRNTIIRWIDGGAKSGDLKKLPQRPTYPSTWSIGVPDVTLSMAKEFEVPAKGTIDYQRFEVPTNFTEDKWIQAYEIMPGTREVVHHVQVYAKAPPALPGTPAIKSALFRSDVFEPLPPPRPRTLLTFFQPEPPSRGTLIASMAPGTNAVEFPPGTAMLVRAGTVLTFTMHYTAKGHVMKDRTTLGFRFAKRPPDEEIYASQFTNTVFTIPAGAGDVQVPSEVGAKEPIRVWGLLPHTHLRGTAWRYKLEKRDGTSEVILDVPNYDFNWQTYYLFTKPLEVPTGARITAVAWYDNSTKNEDNPDPRKDVRHGEQTWEEMQYTGFLYSVPSRTREKAARR